MILFSFLSALLLCVGIVLLLGLTPERITGDLTRLIAPEPSLRSKALTAQGRKKTRKLALAFIRIREALTDTGKGGQFTMVCAAALFSAVAGGVFAALIGNPFLVPVLAVLLAGVPFLYIKSTLAYYDKHVREELETALSIVTTSYVRSEDIVGAVQENIGYIKPPIRGIFQTFLSQVTVISADTKAALTTLSGRIDNDIFREWCACLIQCQDDRTLKSSLLPIVHNLSDVRLVNNELRTMMAEPKKEYWTMVALVAGNIPLLYILNRDWFNTLLFTLPGKIVLALCGVVIFVTTLLMMKYTKPLEYKR